MRYSLAPVGVLVFIGFSACATSESPDVKPQETRVERPGALATEEHAAEARAAEAQARVGDNGERRTTRSIEHGTSSAEAKASEVSAGDDLAGVATPASGGPSGVATSPASTPPRAGKNHADEVVGLYRLVTCGLSEAPERIGARFYRRHCNALDQAVDRYRTRWLDLAAPELAKMVPRDIPDVLVYPFGGGDLLTALATFPGAREITTVSLELSGDVNATARLRRSRVEKLLDNTRELTRFLLMSAHSRTSSMGKVMRSELPGQLILGLIAMSINDHEPVSLRYFTLADDGTPVYADASDIEAALAAAGGSDRARAQVFANAEVEFRKRGDSDAPVRVWRHISANLDDKHLARNPALIKHLQAKGEVSAMTKAASYLLWFEHFSTIRQYLVEHAAWMISDSTGIMPEDASAAGFEQMAYGAFEKPILRPGKKGTKQFRKLFENQPRRPLAFRYGYPDGSAKRHAHLVITRKKQ